jgi:hypothetical protein
MMYLRFAAVAAVEFDDSIVGQKSYFRLGAAPSKGDNPLHQRRRIV